MILACQLNTNIHINVLEDLNKLKSLIENNNLKVNISRLARELGKDRITVKKYIDGYVKTNKRQRQSQFDTYYPLIKELLNDANKLFAYKRVLFQYLKDNYGMPGASSSFRRYISSIDEFDQYFKEKKCASVKTPAHSRFETSPGQQAQLDWKESIDFTLNTGEVITINIFVLILSYSRYRIYRLSLTKTQDILFHYLDESFSIFGGVPQEILTDNMKTVMNIPRTEYSKGKVNNKFQQFADDYGFKVHPCIAGRPNTKAKVESPMRILDELKAYNGDLNYDQLVKKLEEINNRENSRFHKGYQSIPLLYLDKEKDLLNPLPHEKIRDPYQIITKTVKVNQSSMITYKGNQYSLPPEYIDKRLQLQVYDNQIHMYFNTNLVAVHLISNKKMNYLKEHYVEILKLTLPFDNEDIENIAKENLSKIGERYNDNRT